jgi:hypothetical protein
VSSRPSEGRHLAKCGFWLKPDRYTRQNRPSRVVVGGVKIAFFLAKSSTQTDAAPKMGFPVPWSYTQGSCSPSVDRFYCLALNDVRQSPPLEVRD